MKTFSILLERFKDANNKIGLARWEKKKSIILLIKVEINYHHNQIKEETKCTKY